MRSIAAVSALLLIVTPALGQSVTGRVHSAEDGTPVAGVLVVLIGGEESRIGGAITDRAGRYTIRIPEPGRFRVLAERIGFASVASPWFSVGAADTAVMDLSPPVEATTLAGITATASRRCVVGLQEGLAAQRLWDEARKALTATELALEQSLVTWRALDYVRELDPERGAVLRESSTVRNRIGARPYVSAPMETLAGEGFVVSRGDTTTYYAPDAGVLLSDAFLETHCFRGTTSPDGMVGLAFEPTHERRTGGIEGVLWLDPGTSELRRLEYRFAGLPSRAAGHRLGGEAGFRRLPNGAWIMDRWELRLPRPERVDDVTWRCGGGLAVCWVHSRGHLLRLGAIHVEGGEVMEVATLDGRVLSRSSRAALEGSVVDSVTGGPLADAVVFLSGTGHRTRTDSLGRFSMLGLPPGEREVGFMHPNLDSLGIVANPVPVRLVAGEVAVAHLAVPSRPRIAVSTCAGRAIAGTVTDLLTGAPLPGARVVMASGTDEREARSAADGVYHFCGVPEGAIRVQASAAGAASAPLRLHAAGESPARLAADLRIPLSTTIRVSGRVRDFDSGAPIGAALVRLVGTDARQITGRDGRFLFPSVPPGRYRLEAQHVAYGTQSDSLHVGAAAEVEIDLRLPREAIPLEGVVATVTSAAPLGPLAGRGFEERRRLGFGHFVGPEELASGPHRTLPEVLRSIAGVRVQGGSRNEYTVWMARQAPSLGDLQIANRSEPGRPGDGLSPPTCMVLVYVDGVLWRGGIEEIHLADVAGIEVYRGASQIPGEFGGSDARCGVIALWTRRGR